MFFTVDARGRGGGLCLLLMRGNVLSGHIFGQNRAPAWGAGVPLYFHSESCSHVEHPHTFALNLALGWSLLSFSLKTALLRRASSKRARPPSRKKEPSYDTDVYSFSVGCF